MDRRNRLTDMSRRNRLTDMSLSFGAGDAQRPSWSIRPCLRFRWILLLLLVVIAAGGCDGFVVANNPRRLAPICGGAAPPPRTVISSPSCCSGLCFGARFSRFQPHGRHGQLRQPSECLAVPVLRGALGTAPVLTGTSAASSSIYMVLLALQFGLQPILTQRYAGRETSILKTTYVGVQDVTRFTLCGVGLLLSLASTTAGSSVNGFLAATAAAVGTYRPSWEVLVPAVLYNIQNYCSITAYQSLDPITYNVLNQTKTLFAALWCFALLKQRQSVPQMVALVMLVAAAFIMESTTQAPRDETQQAKQKLHKPPTPDPGSSTNTNDERENIAVGQSQTTSDSHPDHRRIGVLAVLAASMTSGLAGAWTQRCLQGRSRSYNALVFSMELSVVSLSILIGTALGKQWLQPKPLVTVPKPSDGVASTASEALRARLFRGWTIKTWIPVITNSFGGILVGLVTKHAGVVPKGFALIIGLFLSGLLQNSVQRTHVSSRQWIGGTLAGLSLYLHAAFPPALN